ncbi:S-adenosylmethionine:tRNA ribosyltransferase-isomerase [bioreactor metagenome]|uniref:S-adenosylmethionine:tRNA ribosyltransferase-isomerase n=1 Tax=bioreactor metagenome TaxID=1076179 RepID=A0A645DY05_9ZZZZ
MKLSKFKFKLPEELIAQYPSRHRDESRLMVIDRKTGQIGHHIFKEVLNFFEEKDLFVFNDTKVFPARMYGNKEKTGAQIEVFLLRELNQKCAYGMFWLNRHVKSVLAINCTLEKMTHW